MKNKLIIILMLAGLVISYKIGLNNQSPENTVTIRVPVVETNEQINKAYNDEPVAKDKTMPESGNTDQTKTRDPGLDAARSGGNRKSPPAPEPDPDNSIIHRKPSLLEQVNEYIVKKGDTLWSIARNKEIDIDTLIGANDISNMNRIKPGQVLKILPVKGILYKVGPGENISLIAEKFGIGEEKIIGSNQLSAQARISPGKLLILPGAKPEFGYQDRLQRLFIKPINTRISSYFGKRWGKRHEGLDFAVPIGTGVKAAGDGKVIFSGWVQGYGNTIIIEHRKGLRTLYGHNSKLLVRSGQIVNRGDLISKSGNTGTTTGPNLHLEVQINGLPVNPLNYLR